MSFSSKQQTDINFMNNPAKFNIEDPHYISMSNLKGMLTWFFSDFCIPWATENLCSCNFICDKAKLRISLEIVRCISLEMVSPTQICGFDLPRKPCVRWTCRAVSLKILLNLNSFNFYIIRGDFPVPSSKFPAVAPEALRLILVFLGQFSILTQALLSVCWDSFQILLHVTLGISFRPEVIVVVLR